MSDYDDPTDFDGKPTLRYEVEGDEYLARTTGDSSYVSQFADGSGIEFHTSSLPDDAAIIETESSGDPLNPDRDEGDE